MKSRLNVNGVDVAFLSELPVSQNMSVKDIREPDKTLGNWTKTISIPGTPEVIKLFENCFEVNAITSNFNANLKTPASYFVNEVEVLKGSLQLLRIINRWENPYMPQTFECSIMGEQGNLFNSLTGLLLTDIDFSDLDHTLTITQPAISDPKFDPVTLGEGYVYGYVDYGCKTNQSPCSADWTFEHLKPAIFEREYAKRIIEGVGYKWEPGLGYWETGHGRLTVIPCVKAGALTLPAATIAANQFYAGKTSDSTTNLTSAHVGSGNWSYGSTSSTVVFGDDTTSPFYDPGLIYNSATGIVTVSTFAFYTFDTNIFLKVTVNPPANTQDITGFMVGLVEIQRSTNSGVSWSSIASSAFGFNLIDGNVFPVGSSVSFYAAYTAVSIPTSCNPGDLVRVRVSSSAGQILFLNSLNAPIGVGTASVDFTIEGIAGGKSAFSGLITKSQLPYGGAVKMNETIPTGVSQIDFLTSIIKEENLYFELDKSDPALYHIHQRETFYTNDVIDWSSKVDVSKDEEIIPLGEVSAKKYVFTKAIDSDHYNQRYFDKWKEVYGTHTEEIDNEFVKGEKKTESAFAATPCASWGGVGPVAPRFFKMTEVNNIPTVTPLECKIRRLIYGIVSTGYGITHSLYINGTPYRMVSYPHFGDVEQPWTPPTVSLNFGIPKEVYYLFPGINHTTVTRYNERYSKYFQEITDRDSKLVKLWINLNENDIYNFSFRKKVWITNSFYRVNRIIDFDPQERKSTQVELLKLKAGDVFIPGTTDVEDTGSGGSSTSLRGGGNIGHGNNNGGEASFITGTNNLIGDGAANVNLLGSTNVRVNGLVTEFTGIGLENEDIDDTYSNTLKFGKLTSAPIKSRSTTVTANFDTSIDIDKYFLDASGGDFDGTLIDTGIEYTFIMKSTGTVTLVPDSGLINGTGPYTVTGANTKITAVFDGTNWYI